MADEQSGTFSHRANLTQLTGSLGNAESRIGNDYMAKQHRSEAIRLAEKLVADFPNEPEALFLRASGVAHDSSNEQLHKAIRDLRELVRLHPTEIRYLSVLSAVLNDAAGSFEETRRLKEADSMYEESVAIDRKLLESRPDDQEFRHRLANALFNYGGHVSIRHPSEAQPLREEAGKILRQLVIDFSSNLRYRHMLARNQNAVGLLLTKLGRSNEAIPALRESVLLMEQLPENYPHPAVRRFRLADFAKDLAVVLEKQGQWGEASGQLDKAIRLLTSPPSLFQDNGIRSFVSNSLVESFQLSIRGSSAHGTSETARQMLKEISKSLWSRNDAGMVIMLAVAYVREGLLDEAIAEAEAVADAAPATVGYSYNAACVISLASAAVEDVTLKVGYGKRAVDLLVQAVGLGWRDADHMMKDTDLDPLRDRDDFKKLLGELQSLTPEASKPVSTPPQVNSPVKP